MTIVPPTQNYHTVRDQTTASNQICLRDYSSSPPGSAHVRGPQACPPTGSPHTRGHIAASRDVTAGSGCS